MAAFRTEPRSEMDALLLCGIFGRPVFSPRKKPELAPDAAQNFMGHGGKKYCTIVVADCRNGFSTYPNKFTKKSMDEEWH